MKICITFNESILQCPCESKVNGTSIEITTNAGIPHFIAVHLIALCKYCICFTDIRLWQPRVEQLYQQHFWKHLLISCLCHILVILILF